MILLHQMCPSQWLHCGPCGTLRSGIVTLDFTMLQNHFAQSLEVTAVPLHEAPTFATGAPARSPSPHGLPHFSPVTLVPHLSATK
jgi:hypothetical protein